MIMVLTTLAGCHTFPIKLKSVIKTAFPDNERVVILPFINHTNAHYHETAHLENVCWYIGCYWYYQSINFEKPKNHQVPRHLIKAYELEQAKIWAINKISPCLFSGNIMKWDYDEQKPFFN